MHLAVRALVDQIQSRDRLAWTLAWREDAFYPQCRFVSQPMHLSEQFAERRSALREVE